MSPQNQLVRHVEELTKTFVNGEVLARELRPGIENSKRPEHGPAHRRGRVDRQKYDGGEMTALVALIRQKLFNDVSGHGRIQD